MLDGMGLSIHVLMFITFSTACFVRLIYNIDCFVGYRRDYSESLIIQHIFIYIYILKHNNVVFISIKPPRKNLLTLQC